MAYGGPKRRRDEEPGVHDLVADAAREAGLSVPEFLEQAAAEHEEEARQRRRAAARRQLRVVEDDERPLAALERQLQGRSGGAVDEKRVADILERAFDEIRASEARTAELIGRLAAPAAAAKPPQSVAEILASAERRASGAGNVVDLHGSRPAPAAAVFARLQETVSRSEVEKALHLLERQLALVDPQDGHDRAVLKGMASEIAAIRAVVSAEGAQVPLAAIEEPISSLTNRIGALAARPRPAMQPSPAAQPSLAAQLRPAATDVQSLDRKLNDVTATTTAMVAGIQDELVRLGQYGLHRDGPAVDASFGRLENRINQLEEAARMPLDQIRGQIDDLRAGPTPRDDSGLRRSIADLERKLEQLTARIAQPLQMVHNAVTQLSRQKHAAAADQSRLDQLFGELAMLKRGIADKAGVAGLSAMERQLAAISHRIEAMAVRMQQDAEPGGPRDPKRKSIDDEIDEIKRLLSEAKSPCDDTRVLDAIGQLEGKIAALENSPQAVMERLDRLQAQLDQRPAAGPPGSLPPNVEILLRNLAARLETPLPSGQSDEAAIARLQTDLREISRKLDAAPAAGFAAPAQDLSSVERMMGDLARKIDVLRTDLDDRAATASAFREFQQPAAPHQDMSGMERSIGDLLRQIDGLRSEVGDRAAQAATAAIRELQPALSAPAIAAEAPPSAQIEESLGQLRRSQMEAEQRTTRTLEALHDTLHRVVDRLGAMEQSARPAPVPAAMQPDFPPAPMPPPMMPPAPMAAALPPTPQAQDAPVFRTETSVRPRAAQPDDAMHLLPPDMLEPRPEHRFEQKPEPRPEPRPEPMRPAPLEAAPAPAARPANSFADTLASIRGGRDSALKPEPAPEPKSAMASAFAAARSAMANLKSGRKGAAEPPMAEPASAQAEPAAAAAQPPAAPEFDMPLEPGAGRPASVIGKTGPMAAAADPKADFIAAARRAAQAAAQQSAAVLAEGEGGRRVGKTGRAPAELTAAAAAGEAKAGGFRARHAILLGVAALIVAAGAGYQFMSFNNRAAAPAATPAVEQPQRSGALQPQSRPQQAQPAAPQARVQQAEAPRQILPPPVAPDRRDPPLTTAAPARPQATAVTAPAAAPPARDEALTVGSIPAPDRVPAGNAPSLAPDDPLLKFEGLKDAPRLRDAARRGDVSAFIELGMRYAEGRGAPRDAKTAALWLERAAEHGSAPAQYRLGTLHREGRGVERDAKTAMKHFLRSAEAGNARAMHNTAVLLAEGVNGSPDYAGAGEWFRKAAEFGIRDSQYNLAILHARGLGVAQDLMASYAWFAAAAANGDEDAAKKRDEVGSRLSAERLQQARAAAQQWKAKTPDVAANEVPMPAGGWDSEAKQVPPGANAPKAAPKRS